MKKTVIQGMDALIQSAKNKQDLPQSFQQEPTTAAGTRPVCYNLPPAIIEKIRYIAFIGHRKNNAVVTEALEQYVKEYEHANGEIQVTL